jgi:hypothetical protein
LYQEKTFDLDHYHPFGLTFNSYTSGDKNNYLYNQGLGEKTFQGEAGKAFEVERQLELQVGVLPGSSSLHQQYRKLSAE